MTLGGNRGQDRKIKVGMTGFEPATTRPPDEYATGLRHIPKFFNKCKVSISVLKIQTFRKRTNSKNLTTSINKCRLHYLYYQSFY